MSRHGQEARSVSLFPFLAVLICAMGALIFLLVVTTRRIRQQAIIQVQNVSVEEVVDADFFPPVLFAAEIEELQEVAPRLTIVETPAVISEPEPQVINLAAEQEAKLKALNLRKAKSLENLKLQNLSLIRLKNELSQSENKLAGTKQQIQMLQQKDEDLIQKMNQVKYKKSRATELLQEELRKLEEKKQSQKTARSKYSIIPYDGQTGTAKRPILIECTDQGLTFLPEGITLTPDDLQDFTPGYNPLLAGTQALSQYWKAKDQPTNQESYVLILVRPSGSVGYYVARKLLNNLKQDSGYELIDADWDFALPAKDPRAEQVCRDAVDRVLSERKKLVSQLHQPQSGSSPRGRVLKFDPRTGMVRVIEPEEEFGTGSGKSSPSEKLAANGNSKSSGKSRFSDVLTRRQQLTRAEYLRKVANQKHIVAQEDAVNGTSDLRGVASGKKNGLSQQKPVGLKSVPGSRQTAEVFDFSELRKQPGGRAAEGTGVKQAQVMNREQMQELAERHLVSLEGSRENRVTESRDRQVGKPDSNSQSSAGRVIENSFSDQRKQTQSNSSQQQAGSHQSRNRLKGVPPGQSASGAGNTSSLSLNRSQQAGGAHSEIKSAKNRQWQQSRSGIGFEREITVHVGADRILVGNDKFIKVDQGVSQEELLQSMIVVMDQYVNSWGPAPKGFYWVPTIQFTISPGGNQYYERLKGSAQKMGLQTESTFTLEPLPVSSALSTEVEK
ncbi:hypothetical protein [uncultured Gimesia sp.]|uniref:hypothetical protein n=1 Tax=uncultured Gimesia sp. TaxID=1678688 RepID=UPI00262BAE5C|nr:hypothetical protein [uncultured Gimesia sp.]